MVRTAKKNTPSNRPSRLRTASYLLSSSFTRSSVGRGGGTGQRKSDAEVTGAGRTQPAVPGERSRRVPGGRN
ncbi:hypothetical protein GCM10010206_32960 [Streptomyces cinerochromogenes]|nr:hypothetical protein GCM10010206_32960 [Streptomyces cinerochromogenes]